MIFSTKFCPKGVYPVKNRKSKHHHWILHIQISLGTKFQLKLMILIFWNKFARKGCFLSKAKSKHYHWILHIRISLGPKFQLKMTIFVFWIKFARKGCFPSKKKKVSTSIEFCIFILVLVPNFSLNWWFYWYQGFQP